MIITPVSLHLIKDSPIYLCFHFYFYSSFRHHVLVSFRNFQVPSKLLQFFLPHFLKILIAATSSSAPPNTKRKNYFLHHHNENSNQLSCSSHSIFQSSILSFFPSIATYKFSFHSYILKAPNKKYCSDRDSPSFSLLPRLSTDSMLK